ncbi:MAG: Hsp20/alpha crystallin family protein [Bdellovibrionales bacterium]
MSNALELWFDNKKMNTFRELSQFDDSFDRLFNEMLTLKKKNGLQEFNFSPSCEIVDEGNNYVMKFDLPGVTKDQVKVEIDKNQLTVSAERKEEKKKETKKKFLSEISYGAYTRSFTLPGSVDEKKVDANFNNGVLTITVPKTEAVNTKQIPIHN